MERKIEEEIMAEFSGQVERIGFSADEIINCALCGRPNAPDRFQCLYCAADLEESADTAMTVKSRNLEAWESGFNIVVLPQKEQLSNEVLSKASTVVNTEIKALTKIVDSGKPFPVIRLETERQAAYVVKHLTEIGVESTLIADARLASDAPPTRIRAIEFSEDELRLKTFNSESEARIPRSNVVLIVTGSLLETRTESVNRRKGGKTISVDEMQSTSTEPLLDFYTADSPTGWRVRSCGFDFACLGSDKTILAGENLRCLASKLESMARGVKLVDDYAAMRRELDHVWELEYTNSSGGFQRGGPGKVNVNSTASVNNLRQFTKYSRLRWNLL